MEILITGGAFIGAILGRFFKVLVVVPVITLAIALLLMKCQFAGIGALDSVICMGLLIASFEFGYITGLISTDIPSAAHGFGKFRARPRH